MEKRMVNENGEKVDKSYPKIFVFINIENPCTSDIKDTLVNIMTKKEHFLNLNKIKLHKN